MNTIPQTDPHRKYDVNKHWKKIETKDGSFLYIAPNGQAFECLNDIRKFFLLMNGIEDGLERFLHELESMQTYQQPHHHHVPSNRKEIELSEVIDIHHSSAAPEIKDDEERSEYFQSSILDGKNCFEPSPLEIAASTDNNRICSAKLMEEITCSNHPDHMSTFETHWSPGVAGNPISPISDSSHVNIDTTDHVETNAFSKQAETNVASINTDQAETNVASINTDQAETNVALNLTTSTVNLEKEDDSGGSHDGVNQGGFVEAKYSHDRSKSTIQTAQANQQSSEGESCTFNAEEKNPFNFIYGKSASCLIKYNCYDNDKFKSRKHFAYTILKQFKRKAIKHWICGLLHDDDTSKDSYHLAIKFGMRKNWKMFIEKIKEYFMGDYVFISTHEKYLTSYLRILQFDDDYIECDFPYNFMYLTPTGNTKQQWYNKGLHPCYGSSTQNNIVNCFDYKADADENNQATPPPITNTILHSLNIEQARNAFSFITPPETPTEGSILLQDEAIMLQNEPNIERKCNFLRCLELIRSKTRTNISSLQTVSGDLKTWPVISEILADKQTGINASESEYCDDQAEINTSELEYCTGNMEVSDKVNNINYTHLLIKEEEEEDTSSITKRLKDESAHNIPDECFAAHEKHINVTEFLSSDYEESVDSSNIVTNNTTCSPHKRKYSNTCAITNSLEVESNIFSNLQAFSNEVLNVETEEVASVEPETKNDSSLRPALSFIVADLPHVLVTAEGELHKKSYSHDIMEVVDKIVETVCLYQDEPILFNHVSHSHKSQCVLKPTDGIHSSYLALVYKDKLTQTAHSQIEVIPTVNKLPLVYKDSLKPTAHSQIEALPSVTPPAHSQIEAPTGNKEQELDVDKLGCRPNLSTSNACSFHLSTSNPDDKCINEPLTPSSTLSCFHHRVHYKYIRIPRIITFVPFEEMKIKQSNSSCCRAEKVQNNTELNVAQRPVRLKQIYTEYKTRLSDNLSNKKRKRKRKLPYIAEDKSTKITNSIQIKRKKSSHDHIPSPKPKYGTDRKNSTKKRLPAEPTYAVCHSKQEVGRLVLPITTAVRPVDVRRNISELPKKTPDAKRRMISPYFSVKQNFSDKLSGRKNRTKSGCRGAHETISYIPPKSPYNLIQEKLYKKPWQLLIATIFLNRTTGQAALPIFWKFVKKYPSPHRLLKATWEEIAKLMQPIGLHEKRAKNIIRFSEEYLNKDWKYPIELYGIGNYGDDSYRMFCLGQWRQVKPNDHKLNLYHEWITEQDSMRLLTNDSC